jgi:hypothetical protein
VVVALSGIGFSKFISLLNCRACWSTAGTNADHPRPPFLTSFAG